MQGLHGGICLSSLFTHAGVHLRINRQGINLPILWRWAFRIYKNSIDKMHYVYSWGLWYYYHHPSYAAILFMYRPIIVRYSNMPNVVWCFDMPDAWPRNEVPWMPKGIITWHNFDITGTNASSGKSTENTTPEAAETNPESGMWQNAESESNEPNVPPAANSDTQAKAKPDEHKTKTKVRSSRWCPVNIQTYLSLHLSIGFSILCCLLLSSIADHRAQVAKKGRQFSAWSEALLYSVSLIFICARACLLALILQGLLIWVWL